MAGRELGRLPESERIALIADVLLYLEMIHEEPTRENIEMYCELEADEVGQFFDMYTDEDVNLLYRDVRVVLAIWKAENARKEKEGGPQT